MIPALIKFFKLVAVKPDEILLNPVEVNKYAMKCGYIVHPKACTSDVIEFLKTQKANLNSTFYKNWATVDKLSEFEMHILQILHYMSTYGTDYKGETFTMNDVPEEMQFSNFTLIMPCTEQELFDRIAAMLKSGVSLAEDTLKPLVEQLSVYHKDYGWEIDIDEVSNREALVMLCTLYGKVPENAHKLFRYIIYIATGNALLIKNQDVFRKISESANNTVANTLATLSAPQKRGLASLFYRYKPLFLALKKNARKCNNPEAVKTINEIRRLAVKYHKPFKPGVLESILSPEHTQEDVGHAIDGESNLFKLVRLFNYLESRMQKHDYAVYIIRNGKSFLRFSAPTYTDTGRLESIKNLIKNRIVSLLSVKSKDINGRNLTVRFPDHLQLAAPVSEKQFVGNVPFGSYYTLLVNNYIGIYWRNEWGTRDFDLWMVDVNGGRLGWADLHKTDEVMFSGDMTDADPEATEVFYGKKDWPDCTIRVSRFNGEQGSKYRLFFGTDNITKLDLNYMVNPDSIQFQEDIKSDKREQVVGIVNDRKVYFTSVNTTNNRLPDNDTTVSFEKAFGEKFSGFMNLREIMLESGFVEFKDNAADMPAVPDIDFTKLNKDTLISLFS